MKKVFLMAVVSLCAAVIFSSLFISSASEKSDVTQKNDEKISEEQIFVDMLNHNYVYGEDFDNADRVINRSANALSMYKTDSGNFIGQHYVADFVKNMYGISVVDFSGLNEGYPKKQDCVYVLPFEYTSFCHSNPKISENEDGTVSVKTEVTVTDCNGRANDYEANSVFVKCSESEFGYYILYSEISEIAFSA